VALPAYAAARRTAARLLLTAGRAAIDRHLLADGSTAANPPQQRRAAAGWDRQTDDSCISQEVSCALLSADDTHTFTEFVDFICSSSINQSCIFRVVQVIKSLQDPLDVENNILHIPI